MQRTYFPLGGFKSIGGHSFIYKNIAPVFITNFAQKKERYD